MASASMTVTIEPWLVPVYVFLLDTIPDYIQKTFGVDANGKVTRSGMFGRTLREGGVIPADTHTAIIVYNTHEYQIKMAYELEEQIKAINPGATVVGIPVEG